MAIKKEWIIPMGYKIKQGGVFHMEYLYKDIYRWFEHYHYNWKEIQYRQEVAPDGTLHLEIRWTANKPLNNYLSVGIDMEFLIFMKDAEVEIKGKKVKRQKGTIEIRTGAYVGYDEDYFSKMNTIKKIYYNLLIRDKIDSVEEDIYVESQELFKMIKEFLELNRE